MMSLKVSERSLLRKCEDYASDMRQYERTDWEALEKIMGHHYAEKKHDEMWAYARRSFDRVDTIGMMLGANAVDLLNWWRGCKRVKSWTARKELLRFYVEHGHGYWMHREVDND